MLSDLQYLDRRIQQLHDELQRLCDPLHRGFARIEIEDLRAQLHDRLLQHLRDGATVPWFTAASLPVPEVYEGAGAPPLAEELRSSERRRRPSLQRQVLTRARQIGLRRALAALPRERA